MNDYIENVDWNAIFMEDPENFSQHFEKTISDICHLCAPLKNSYSEIPLSKKSQKSKFAISGLKRKKKIMRCRVKDLQALNPSSHRISFLKANLSNIDSRIKSELSLVRQNEETKAVSVIKSNPKYFYSFARKFSKVKSGEFVSDPQKMADLLQKQFCSVFSNPQSSDIEDPTFPQANTCLEDFELIIEDFISAIEEMKIYSAPGEDELPATLFKK